MAQRTRPQLASAPNMAALKRLEVMTLLAEILAASRVSAPEAVQFGKNDLIPFKSGIEAGAGAVMVCHNIVNAMDPSMPASLSGPVNKLLRDELGFRGVVITDDLIMDAISTRYDDGEAAVLAVLAGNDMLITTWSDARYQAILDAVAQGRISPERIRQSAVRVLQWKMDLGLIE